VVGAVAGLLGTAFFYGLELVQRWVLERGAGYQPLRAAGELFTGEDAATTFRPWLLFVLPAVGALGGGLLAFFFAPEARGGGAEAMLQAFHQHGGVVRRRVALIKGLASILTLGFGGSGGREGPTMQIGGAIGSLVGRYLKVTPRERRVLLLAGVAAGMAAVFRTPLGAALLAAELVYRDDFESEAMIPALLASVVSYSVFVSILGESKLFAHAAAYPFVPAHLVWYGLMAIVIAALSGAFLSLLRGVQALMRRSRIPAWLQPALGGLALGAMATPLVVYVGPRIGQAGQGLGIFGGGYGLAQIAITGASWLPGGWLGVELLVVAGLAKIVATSFTVGSGGSAGDFGPSLVMGGAFGAAFGHALQLVLHDPRIDPGAFALVGMGTFYGGIAHVPISSLVMVCELAGSYDLLVPLMLAEAIAFVALRKRSLYRAQVASKRDSPAHSDDLDVLSGQHVCDVVKPRPVVTFTLATPTSAIVQALAANPAQIVFPVIGDNGRIEGTITSDLLRTYVADGEFVAVTVAADLMGPAVSVSLDEEIARAVQLMLSEHVRELPVIDGEHRIIGLLDEADVARSYVRSTRERQQPPPSSR
jgi:CIC family chloride channel protein